MIIEALYPEDCLCFGDNGNLMMLKACLPEAVVHCDHFTEEPYFVKNRPDIMIMGGMSESVQERVIKELLPHKKRIQELIEEGVVILFTSNAIEVLFSYIENEDGSRIEALNLYPLYAKRNMMKRFNCHYIGYDAQKNPLLGFKSQFTFAYGNNPHPWITTQRGIGIHPQEILEGIHDHNLYATYLIGPLLTMNPHFTKHLLFLITKQEREIAYKEEALLAFERHLKEFNDPKTVFFEAD